MFRSHQHASVDLHYLNSIHKHPTQIGLHACTPKNNKDFPITNRTIYEEGPQGNLHAEEFVSSFFFFHWD
jgi:hypothetical protein